MRLGFLTFIAAVFFFAAISAVADGDDFEILEPLDVSTPTGDERALESQEPPEPPRERAPGARLLNKDDLGFGTVNLDGVGLSFLRPFVGMKDGRFFFLPRPGSAKTLRGTPNNFVERNLGSFVDIFRDFLEYFKEFSREKDRYFANIKDFRATYRKAIAKNFPGIMFHAEGVRYTTETANSIMRIEGGGAGIQINVVPGKNDVFYFTVLPVYGERRSFYEPGTYAYQARDYILRSSAAVGYAHRFGNAADAGAQFFFQPQIIAFSQFRIYAETYVRFRVFKNKSLGTKYLKIAEIHIVPKAVYWHSTDKEGIYGDSVETLLKENYRSLRQNLYGFLNLEFRFKM